MDQPTSSRWQQYDQPDPPDAPADHPSATASWRDAMRQFAQLKAFAAHYAAARSDRFMASIRNGALWAGVGVMGLFLTAGIVVTAGVLLVTGLADGISRLLGTGPWAGQLLASVLILGLIATGMIVGLGFIRRRWRQQTERKYEQRQLQQRIDHGQDVRQCAAADAGNGRH